jgi:pteridine reductase
MNNKSSHKNVLITGAARRLGAEIARYLHQQGFNVIVHYRQSQSDAEQLCAELNQKRADSATAIAADLSDLEAITHLAEKAASIWNGLDVLVNNASSFYPTAITEVTEQQWDELLSSNLKAPFFLVKALVPALKQRQGCIVNLIDIHAERGLQGYPVYSIAKAGLAAMTRVLAKELGPEIRVNGVSPGAVLWPENNIGDDKKQEIVSRTLLQRCGEPNDIARAVHYLINDAGYVTGQIIAVDGGRTLYC